MHRIALILACGVFSALVACGAGTPTGSDAAAARAEIAAAIRSWEGHWRRGDAAAAAGGFTVDAINMRPGGASEVGRNAVEAMFRDFLSRVTVTEISFSTEELDVLGDTAYERGTAVQRYTDGRTETTQRSRYMAMWRRGDDGAWRYHRFLFNNELANGSGPREPPSADPDAARAALREADSRYAKLMMAKDAEGVSALYAPDAAIYPPDGAAVNGLEAVRAFAAEFTAVPGLTIGSVRPLVIEVSRDGDLGYTVNAVEMTVSDEAGNPVAQRLRDVHLWRQQEDGSWKVVVDVWNAEPVPATASSR